MLISIILSLIAADGILAILSIMFAWDMLFDVTALILVVSGSVFIIGLIVSSWRDTVRRRRSKK